MRTPLRWLAWTLGACTPGSDARVDDTDPGDSDDGDTDVDTDPPDTGTYDGSGDRAAPTTVAFPAGTFTLGSPVGELGRTPGEPVREVALSQGFLMMTVEVSQARYAAWMGEEPSAWAGCPRCPVEGVSWYDAARFANAASTADGLDLCYRCTEPTDNTPSTCRPEGLPTACSGWRLPTEAEWEVAARAGQSGATPSGGNLVDADDRSRCDAPLTLDNGTTLDDQAWFCGNTDAVPGLATRPGGRKPANAAGLYDVLGNVWEWCHDGWGEPPPSGTDPLGPEDERRVVRGGGWNSAPRETRLAFRTLARASQTSDAVGFRLVRSAP